MDSRYEVGIEQYLMTLNVEANLTADVAQTIILPTAIRYQTELASNVAALKAAGVDADTADLLVVSGLIAELRSGLTELKTAVAGAHDHEGIEEAAYVRDAVIPAMAKIREAADTLEGFVADDLWSLPTYQEMLFIL
jgi:glutamine synthetase